MKYHKKTKTYMIIKKEYGGKEMEIGYEESIDDLGIILTENYEYDTSVEIEPGYIIDLDKKNRLVAIEILDCSKRIKESKAYVKNAEIKVFVEVYEYSYKIVIDFNNGEHEIVRRVLK